MKAARIIVSGRVQGVFFRLSTKKQAELMGVKGWARNLDDGTVEILAVGGDIDGLVKWCRKGPAASRVDDVRKEDIQPTQIPSDIDRFSVR